MSDQAVVDLHIDLVGIDWTAAEQYRRELDLDSAIARSRFIAEGVTYTREAFASASDGVIVVSLGAEGGTIDAEFALSSGQRVDIDAANSEVTMRGRNNADRGIEIGRAHV